MALEKMESQFRIYVFQSRSRSRNGYSFQSPYWSTRSRLYSLGCFYALLFLWSSNFGDGHQTAKNYYGYPQCCADDHRHSGN